MTNQEIARAVDAIYRIESPKLIAFLVRMLRDVGRAEELAQDVLIAALEEWPRTGIPDVPGAWLRRTAQNRAIDELRRHKLHREKQEALGRELDDEERPDPDDALDDDIGDELLRLLFVCCHPVLAREGRVALTLRLLGGLTTQEIARAFLLPETTLAQRLVRAKRALSESNEPFEVPRGEARIARLSSVLEVIYLIFNEGYAATAGSDWMRPQLVEDALRLARVLVGLAPKEPEVHGLLALLEIQASRSKARVDAAGEPILLMDQNRALWDHLAIERGLSSLAKAESLSSSRGAYTLQAGIAACHGRVKKAGDTDWARIVALYDALAELTPSPIVDLNRAVAIARAEGPAAGLAELDLVQEAGALGDYHLLYAARADCLAALSRFDEARAELERAASLTENERERAMLRKRAESLR